MIHGVRHSFFLFNTKAANFFVSQLAEYEIMATFTIGNRT